MHTTIIIGGGVAGLGAAYKIRRAADAGHDVDFILVEKESRLGGKLATDHIEVDGVGAFVVDGGSDSFLTEKTAVHRVARLLGIIDDEVSTCDENKKTYIVKNGRLVELPDGIMMFAPTKILPMATTSLYSWPAKLRMALDLVLPRKKLAEGQRNEESLESFVVRRLGREALDRLAEPLVGGVNGSDPAEMSLAATYPMLLDMEQTHGSLVRGFLAQRKKVEEIKKRYPPKPGERRRTFFTSFAHGLQQLTDRMADAAGRDRIRVGVGATALSRRSDGIWEVALSDGTVLEGNAVVVATEVWAAAALSIQVDERIARVLSEIPSTSSATVALAYDLKDFPADRAWHGILSPRIERQPVTGVSLVSSKWPNRAPEGSVLLRAFVGGPHNKSALELGDDSLVEMVRAGLSGLLGIDGAAAPLFSRVYRWDRGMPQYSLGHLERVEEIESRVADISGFALAGGGFRGVGVPNCLESGEHAASKVLADVGIELEEDAVKEQRVY